MQQQNVLSVVTGRSIAASIVSTKDLRIDRQRVDQAWGRLGWQTGPSKSWSASHRRVASTDAREELPARVALFCTEGGLSQTRG